MAMTEPRNPFAEVVRHGWFAWVYWSASIAGIIAVAVILIWAPGLLAVSGYVVITLVIALLAARYLLAARLRHERTAALEQRRGDQRA
jgi:hypothetical protein